MPSNPQRSTKGGDVEGQTPIDTSHTIGEPTIMVAKASFEPGYDITTVLSDAGTKLSKADVVTGYCSYGKAIGE